MYATIAMSRHPARQAIARQFGATDIIAARGEGGMAQVRDLTKGIGADSVLECVGTQRVADAYRAMDQRAAIKAILRP